MSDAPATGHAVSTAHSCGCQQPFFRRVTRHLDSLSRRGFLGGIAAASACTLPGFAFGQGGGPTRTLLRQVRLFDGKGNALRDGVQVLVEGNKITSIDTGNSAPPAGATVIDCGGRVLMPGLIDAHWHTLFCAVPAELLVMGDPAVVFTAGTAEANRTLMRGFTTIRDLGGPVFTFKQAIDNGVISGPRIYPSGAMITTSGGHGDLRLPFEIPRSGDETAIGEAFGGMAIVDDPGTMRLRAREQLLQGASQIKLVASGGVSSPRSPLDIATFSQEELNAGVAVARDWNTYAAVHAYTPHTALRALAAEAACIEHAHLIDEATARRIAEKRVWISTQPFLSMEDTGQLSGPAVGRAQQLFAGTARLYGYCKRYGIKTAWGSDLLFSAALLPRQNFMLTHLGNWFTNAEVLRAATSVNAELLALSGPRNPYPDKLGVIEPGAYADMLLVNGNPLDNLHLLEDPGANLAIIMKDGRIHKNTL